MIRRKMPLASLGILLGTLLLLAASLITLNRTSSTLPQGEPPISAATPSPTHPNKNEVIFAGISGMEPRYIDSGPKKGYGWQEVQTQGIRKQVEANGFHLQQEWMTPARIEHEFASQNPICTYPAKWKDPNQLFKKKGDRIYSIPLDIQGDETKFILIHTSDLKKFKPYLDEAGTVRIGDLLEDPSLKTVLIRDVDYGDITKKVVEQSEFREEEVKAQFEKNVSIILVRENIQLVEMLNARRFDYIFAESLEELNFYQAKIDPGQFTKLPYSFGSVQDLSDPSLVRVSVACSIHPLSLQVMPFFNEAIKMKRGFVWSKFNQEYRSRLDRTYQNKGDLSLVSKFKHSFEGGQADKWFSLQQAHYPTLSLFPKRPPIQLTPKEITSFEDNHSKKKVLLWKWLSVGKTGAILVNEADLHRPHKGQYWSWLPDWFKPETVSQEVRKALEAAANDPGGRFSAIPFEQLPFNKLKDLSTSLTLFASGLSATQILRVSETLPSLRLDELNVFDASSAAAPLILDALPKSLTRLNLTGSSLAAAHPAPSISKMKLKALHLNATQLPPEELLAVIHALPPSIEELSLGLLATSWNASVAKALSLKKAPSLRTLDLSNSNLFDEDLLLISRILSKQLSALRLNRNPLTLKSLAPLLRLPLPLLSELELSHTLLGTQEYQELPFPKGLRSLGLAHTSLSPMDFKKIGWPSHLKSLNVSGNNLGDEEFSRVLTQIDPQLESLRAAGASIGLKGVRSLVDSKAQVIQALDLSSNNLGDSGVSTLAQSKAHIFQLDLTNVGMTDQGASAVADRLVGSLTELAIGLNPVGIEGIKQICARLSNQLVSLDFQGIVAIDFEVLAKSLPGSLKILRLNYTGISDNELEILSPAFPRHLKILDLNEANLTEKGAWTLANSMPQELERLSLDHVQLGGRGLAWIAQALPPSMEYFNPGFGTLSPAQSLAFQNALPPGLKRFLLSGVEFQGQGLHSILTALPSSLLYLGLASVTTSETELIGDMSSWAKNVRAFSLSWIVPKTSPKTSTKTPVLFSNFPDSLVDFRLNCGGNEKIFFKNSSKNSQTFKANLEYFELIDCVATGLAEVLQRSKNLSSLVLVSDQLQRSQLNFLKHDRFERLTRLWLSSNPLADQVVSLFGRGTRLQHLRELSLASTGLRLRDVEPLIKALPKTHLLLDISGNDFGQKGLEQFRMLTRGRNKIPLQLKE